MGTKKGAKIMDYIKDYRVVKVSRKHSDTDRYYLTFEYTDYNDQVRTEIRTCETTKAHLSDEQIRQSLKDIVKDLAEKRQSFSYTYMNEALVKEILGRGKDGSTHMEVNPHSELIVWMARWYQKNGYSNEEALRKALTIGMAIGKKLIEPTSVFRKLFSMVQSQEKQREVGGY